VCPLVWHFLCREPGIAAPTALAPSSRRSRLRQPGFATISAAFALGLFAQIGLVAHLIARLGPEFGSGVAAAATTLITLCAIAGRTRFGWLVGDRDRRVVAAANLLMQATGSLLLAFGEGIGPLAAGCVLFGLGVGNLVSLPPLIAQSEFRPADVGTVVALVTAINQAVFALAPAIFGALRDFTGNYVLAFLMAAAVQAVAARVIVQGRRRS
ncbi:MAG: YbfB/YjiJ family MFS transporter, partial [Reyranella sp.]